MADKVTTLHPIGSLDVDIYPNIKTECIPNTSITREKLGFEIYCTNFYIEEQDPDYVRFFTFTPFKVVEIRDILEFFDIGDEFNCTGTMNQEMIVKGRITFFNGSKFLEVVTMSGTYVIRHDYSSFKCDIVWNRVL